MNEDKRTVNKLVIARSINNFGSSFSDFVLPLLIFEVTKSPSLMAAQWGVNALSKFLAGKFAGRIGFFDSNKNALVVLDLIQGLATLFPLLFWNTAPTVGIFISGIIISFLVTIQTGYLECSILKMTDLSQNIAEIRSEINASLENGKYIGQFLGYLCALVSATFVGYKAAISIDAITFFMSGLITLTIVDQSKHELSNNVKESFSLLFANQALSLLTTSQCFLSFSIFIFNSSFTYLLRDKFIASDGAITFFLSSQAMAYIIGSAFAKRFKMISARWNLALRSAYFLVFMGFYLANNFYQFLFYNCLLSILISFSQPKIIAIFQSFASIETSRSFGASRVSLMAISGLLGSVFCATFAKLGYNYQYVFLVGAVSCGASALLFKQFIRISEIKVKVVNSPVSIS